MTDLLTTIGVRIGALVTAVLALMKLWELVKKALGVVTTHHDEKKRDFELQEMVKRHDKELAEFRTIYDEKLKAVEKAFSELMRTIKNELCMYDEETKRYRRASMKTKIVSYWEKSKQQQYVTKYDLKMVADCVEVFKSNIVEDGEAEDLEVDKYVSDLKELEVR